MKLHSNRLVKFIYRLLCSIGIDMRKLSHVSKLVVFLKHRKQWIDQGGTIDEYFTILSDFTDSAGSTKGHYFHQDIHVANQIFHRNPRRHIDVGSRIDGFVAHVASFREIEVIDIRPLPKSEHENLKFVQADLMTRQDIGQADSVSCLHAIEHFGLGRYTDAIDVNGHRKGIANLIDLVEIGGFLYISFPVATKSSVSFNAHRIFSPFEILEYDDVKGALTLVCFSYIDDSGNFYSDVRPSDIPEVTSFGCGIYVFRKHAN